LPSKVGVQADRKQGVIQIKANYTFFAFKWGWAELGPYMSFVGFCRFLVLVGLMPRE
jgi:hypothetical protein